MCVLSDHYGCQNPYGNKKKATIMKKTKMKPLQRIINWFIDFTDLRPIIIDVLDVFWGVRVHLVVSTKTFGSGVLGPPYGVKTLKLQYL